MRRRRNDWGGKPPSAVTICLDQGRGMDDAAADRIPTHVVRTTDMMARTALNAEAPGTPVGPLSDLFS